MAVVATGASVITRRRATLAAMKPTTLAILCLLALGLSGCGNKGPLVLPGAPADAVQPLDAPVDGDPDPESLNDANPQPVEGDGSEGGEAATPPVPPSR